EVIDKSPYGRSVRSNSIGAQLGLGLGLKDGFLNTDSHGADDTLPNIRSVKIFFVKLPDRFYYRLSKGCQMCPSLCGKLPVDEGVVLLAVLIGMGEGHFYIVSFQMDDRVSSAFLIQLSAHQVQQTVF